MIRNINIELKNLYFYLILLLICAIPTIYFIFNNITGPYFGAHITLTKISESTGFIALDPYAPLGMVQSQINYASTRTFGLTALLTELRLITGVSYQDIMFLPIGFFLIFLMASILVRTITSNKLLIAFFLIFISWNPLIYNMYSTNRTAWSFFLLYLMLYLYLSQKYGVKEKVILCGFLFLALSVLYYTIAIFFLLFSLIYFILPPLREQRLGKRINLKILLIIITTISLSLLILWYVRIIPSFDILGIFGHLFERFIFIITGIGSGYPTYFNPLAMVIRIFIYLFLMISIILFFIIITWREYKWRKGLTTHERISLSLFITTFMYIIATASIGLPFRLEFIWLTFPIIIVLFFSSNRYKYSQKKNKLTVKSINFGLVKKHIPTLLTIFVILNLVVSVNGPPYTTYRFEEKYSSGLTWVGDQSSSEDFILTNLVLAYQGIMIVPHVAIEHYWYQPTYRSRFDTVNFAFRNSSDYIEEYFANTTHKFLIISKKDLEDGVTVGLPGGYLGPAPTYKDVIDASDKFDLVYSDGYIHAYRFPR